MRDDPTGVMQYRDRTVRFHDVEHQNLLWLRHLVPSIADLAVLSSGCRMGDYQYFNPLISGLYRHRHRMGAMLMRRRMSSPAIRHRCWFRPGGTLVAVFNRWEMPLRCRDPKEVKWAESWAANILRVMHRIELKIRNNRKYENVLWGRVANRYSWENWRKSMTVKAIWDLTASSG